MILEKKELVADYYQKQNTHEFPSIRNLKIQISPSDLSKIPEKGQFVSVSNRPIGIIEEFILAIALKDRRPDINFLNNSFLKEETEFYHQKISDNHVLCMQEILKANKGLSIFPVGNRSNFQNEQLG